jgi:hypothetical protein
MKKLRFVLLATLVSGIALSISRRSAAQLSNTAEEKGTLGEFEQLVLTFSKNGDTNTVKQFTDFVRDTSAQKCATEAGIYARVLSDLRSGRTNEALELLETRLDGAVIAFASPAQGKHYPQYDKILEQVKNYRTKYPHSSKNPENDATVRGALDSLPKR